MNIVKSKEYMRGGAMEYGKGGRMPQELLEYFKKKQGKEYGAGGYVEYQDGGENRPYIMSGYSNNPGDDGRPSGREGMYVVAPGAEGADPRVMDLRSAMKEYGYEDPVEMARAFGVEASRGDRGFTAPGAEDAAYRRRLISAMGADSYEGLQYRLGIGRIDYERKSDLPVIMRANQGRM